MGGGGTSRRVDPTCRFFFFFQAEDGIRDVAVTGVQTCALPICRGTPLRDPRRRRRAAQDRVQRGPRNGTPGDVRKPDVRRVLAGREGDSSSSPRDRARYEPPGLDRKSVV